jgi:hypothetical protein
MCRRICAGSHVFYSKSNQFVWFSRYRIGLQTANLTHTATGATASDPLKVIRSNESGGFHTSKTLNGRLGSHPDYGKYALVINPGQKMGAEKRDPGLKRPGSGN